MNNKDRTFIRRYGAWAVVTGASSGIGREIAFDAAARGLHIVLAARNVAAMESIASSITERHGVQTKILACDFTTAEATDRLLAECVEIDVGLFVAAAGFGAAGAFLTTDLQVDREMLAVNCGAVLVQTHAFAKRFAAQGRGGIVLFSSIVGYQGVPGAAHYAATKAYIHSLTEGLAPELKAVGVDIVATAPSSVHTGFGKRANMAMRSADDPQTVARETLSALGRRTIAVPAPLTKLLTYSLAPLPRSLRVRIMGTAMSGMTVPTGAK